MVEIETEIMVETLVETETMVETLVEKSKFKMWNLIHDIGNKYVIKYVQFLPKNAFTLI